MLQDYTFENINSPFFFLFEEVGGGDPAAGVKCSTFESGF